MLHEQRIDKIYRPLRQDTEKFFYDPLWSLDHTLPRLFLERECEFYGYKLRGFQAAMMLLTAKLLCKRENCVSRPAIICSFMSIRIEAAEISLLCF